MEEIVLELLLGSLALADVAVHDHQLRHLALAVSNRAGHRLQYAPASILVLDAVLESLANAGFARLARGLKHPETIVRMNLLEGRGLAQFCRRVPQNLLVGRAVVETAPFHVDQRDHVRRVFGDNLEKLFLGFCLALDPVETQLLVQQQDHHRSERNPEPLRQHADFSLRTDIGRIR